MVGAQTLVLETVLLAQLRPHPQNYRTHPEDQLEHIQASILENGLYRNVVVAEDYTILAGHGVVEALRRLGREMVDVYRLCLSPDDVRAIKVLVGDNEVTVAAVTSQQNLVKILSEVGETSATGLVGTGYDDMMLTLLSMVERPSSLIAVFDPWAEWWEMPEHDPGPEVYTMRMRFTSEGELFAFVAKVGFGRRDLKKIGSVYSTWWPSPENEDRSSIRFEEVDHGAG